jgi:hypothetical protein
MICRQVLHRDPIAISYVFGCAGKAVGAVCDPIDDLELYLGILDENGLPLATLLIRICMRIIFRAAGNWRNAPVRNMYSTQTPILRWKFVV